jgi:hypothetical protein
MCIGTTGSRHLDFDFLYSMRFTGLDIASMPQHHDTLIHTIVSFPYRRNTGTFLYSLSFSFLNGHDGIMRTEAERSAMKRYPCLFWGCFLLRRVEGWGCTGDMRDVVGVVHNVCHHRRKVERKRRVVHNKSSPRISREGVVGGT